MTDSTQPYLWRSVYIPSEKRKPVIQAIQAVYQDAGYTPYNPFSGGDGTPAQAEQLVKFFLSPKKDGWIRLIGEPVIELLPSLADALDTSILHAWVSEDAHYIEVIGGEAIEDFLASGQTMADFNAEVDLSDAPSEDGQMDELTRYAVEQGVDATQANQLIQKTADTMFRKLGKRAKQNPDDLQQNAQSLIQQQQGFSWNSLPAQQLSHQMNCLMVPSDWWREPNFGTLSAAYQIACMIDQNPNTLLLPNDEAILDQVAYPLDYKLAFFAK